jgi:hypothetical protein
MGRPELTANFYVRAHPNYIRQSAEADTERPELTANFYVRAHHQRSTIIGSRYGKARIYSTTDVIIGHFGNLRNKSVFY